MHNKKQLGDILLAHQIATIKHAAELGQSVVPYLNEMKAIIRKKVAGFDSEKRTAKRLQTMLNTLANTLNKPAGAWLAELEKSLKDFAKYEAAYQAETIGGWVGVNFTEPTIGQVWAAAQFQPLALGTSPIDFQKMIDDWGLGEVDRLVKGVKIGFTQGLSVTQIIKNVVGDGGLADISLRNAKAVANTAMMHVATNARMAVLEENDDVVIGYELVATLDKRTCVTPDTSVLTSRGYVPIGMVRAGDMVIGHSGYEREVLAVINGTTKQLLSVELESGKIVKCTKDHLWLTENRGWVEAGDLTCDDDISEVQMVQLRTN